MEFNIVIDASGSKIADTMILKSVNNVPACGFTALGTDGIFVSLKIYAQNSWGVTAVSSKMPPAGELAAAMRRTRIRVFELGY